MAKVYVGLSRLISMFSDAKSIFDPALQEEYLSNLADLDVGAAKRAIKLLDKTRDKESQIWSAINHLQSAREKYRHRYKGGWIKTQLLPLEHKFFRKLAMSKEWKCLLMMALLYFHLGEVENARATLSEIQLDEGFRRQHLVQIQTNILNPLTYVALYKWIFEPHLKWSEAIDLRDRILGMIADQTRSVEAGCGSKEE